MTNPTQPKFALPTPTPFPTVEVIARTPRWPVPALCPPAGGHSPTRPSASALPPTNDSQVEPPQTSKMKRKRNRTKAP